MIALHVLLIFAASVNVNSLPQWQWTRQRGASGEDHTKAIALDSAGNVKLAGFSGWGDSDGNVSVYLTTFDSSGNLKSTWQQGMSAVSYRNALAVDSAGNVFVAGRTPLGLDGNSNAGRNDIFLMKYDSSGTWAWTRQRGTPTDDQATTLALDLAGNIYIAGGTRGALDGNNRSSSFPDTDAFLMKYDSSGSWKWTRQAGSSEMDEATALAVDSTGNVFVAGVTQGALHGNSRSYVGSEMETEVFLMKYDSSGNWKWTQQRGAAGSIGIGGSVASAVALDAAGNVFLAGHTSFGAFDGYSNAGCSDVFLMKYDSLGTWAWTRQRGTRSCDESMALSLDVAGNAFLAGSTRGDFDGNSNAGLRDVFLMKFDSSGTWEWTQQRGSSDEDCPMALALDSSGNASYLAGWTKGALDGNSHAGDQDLFLMKYVLNATVEKPTEEPEEPATSDGGVSACILPTVIVLSATHVWLGI